MRHPGRYGAPRVVGGGRARHGGAGSCWFRGHSMPQPDRSPRHAWSLAEPPGTMHPCRSESSVRACVRATAPGSVTRRCSINSHVAATLLTLPIPPLPQLCSVTKVPHTRGSTAVAAPTNRRNSKPVHTLRKVLLFRHKGVETGLRQSRLCAGLSRRIASGTAAPGGRRFDHDVNRAFSGGRMLV